jgi:hypothetical protein
MRPLIHSVIPASLCLLAGLALASCESSLPTREQSAGNCIAEADCASSGQVCKAYQCVACQQNSDCGSQICDAYGDLGGAGRCVTPSQTYFVDNNDANQEFCLSADGSAKHPFCSIGEVLGKLATSTSSGPAYIRVLASPNAYGLPALASLKNPLVLTGPGSSKAGQAASIIADTDDGLLQISGTSKVVIDGFVISALGLSSTSGTTLTMRRSLLRDLVSPAMFTSATVTLDRMQISSNYAGLSFDGGTLQLTNSVITGNAIPDGQSLITLAGGSGTMQFTTLYKNMLATATAQVVSCKNSSTVSIKNSIVASNGVTGQIAAACSVVSGSLVVGTSDNTSGQIKQDPVFVDPSGLDLRLKPFDPINTQYVIDKAVGVSPGDKNTDHDYYGTPRPQGAGHDIGAVEFLP